VAVENPHLQAVVDQDGAVILDIKRNILSTLNGTGAYVWEELRQGRPLNEIIHSLALETGTDLSIIERDVNDFLGELKSQHLLPH
jgi:Coenzyme PQQ synthesis protein D (PqqD)